MPRLALVLGVLGLTFLSPEGEGRAGTGGQKVVLVVIDGLRLGDSYKYAQLPNPLHPPANHTPQLTALFSQGTLYTNARCGRFATVTTPGFNTIVTGAWHGGPNRGRGEEGNDDDFVDNRPLLPTLFEHLRKDRGLPADKVVGITNKLNSRLSNYSLHPAYGEAWGPAWTELPMVFNPVEPPGEETYLDPDYNSDLWVVQAGLQALDAQEPDLLMMALGQVDIAGHQGADNFGFYTDCIGNADRLIADLWQQLQGRPAYQGKTTLIVTTDHGRHEDHSLNAFVSHHGSCLGCRDLLLFVAGPATPAGLQVSRRVWQTDVAVSAARLLGTGMPHASGQPLYEALALAKGPDSRPFLQHTRAALLPDGSLLAVSREAVDGENRIVSRRAGPGLGFEPPVTVAAAPGDDAFLADDPAVMADASGAHVCHFQWTEQNHKLLYRRSQDGGRSWSSPSVLAKGKSEDSGKGLVDLRMPLLANLGARQRLFLPVGVNGPGPYFGSSIFQLDYGTGGFLSDPARIHEDLIGNIRREGYHDGLGVLEASDGALLACYAAMRLPSDLGTVPLRATWEVFFKDLSGPGSAPPVRLTDNNTTPDLMPALAVDRAGGDGLALVYASKPAGGPWQLHLRTSADRLDWTPAAALTASPAGAWEPQAAFVTGGHLAVAYTDHAAGNGDIFLLSVIGGVPGMPRNLSDSPGISRNPSLLVTPAGTCQVVWEEQSGAGFVLAKAEVVP